MTAWYNEFDPEAAEWLRELIKMGQIADGIVDERDIRDVRADELQDFTQCHFFAGIGGWSLALRIAEWPDSKPVWTGSPPCQPFSTAGTGKGRNDERHLAPHFISLVGSARPPVLFGEQVASADVFGKVAGKARKGPPTPPPWAWFDDLSDRLEAAYYAVGASDIPAAGVSAPNIRQRTFFGAQDLRRAEHGVANCTITRLEERNVEPRGEKGVERFERFRPSSKLGDECCVRRHTRGNRDHKGHDGPKPDPTITTGGLADISGARLQGQEWEGSPTPQRPPSGHIIERDSLGGLANCRSRGSAARISEPQQRENGVSGEHDHSCDQRHGRKTTFAGTSPSPSNSFWGAVDWLLCRDERWRPVEPGTFPLAHGISGRVGLLRGYGNAINPWAAAEFIQAFEGVTL